MSTKPTVGMRVLLLNGGSGVTVRWDATVGAVVGDWCGLEVMGHDGKVFTENAEKDGKNRGKTSEAPVLSR